MTARRSPLTQHRSFNVLLLCVASAAFGLGVWFDLAVRFAQAVNGTTPLVPNIVLSFIAVLAVAFPIFAIHRTAHIRRLNRQRQVIEAQGHYAARHDPLTGLCNRLFMHEVLENNKKSANSRAGLVLFLIDIDHFKPVNDLRGRDVGDQVLIEIAKRVRQVSPPGATLGRTGGDKFSVLLRTPSDHGAVEQLASDLTAAMTDPITVGNFTISVTVSIGIAYWSPDVSISDLLLRADQALRAAKAGGRAQYRFFDAEIGLMLREDALLQADLIEAVMGDGLYCVYQPYYDVADNRLVGAEVLARWEHPALGHIPPERFIKLADKLGLIDRLSDQLLEKACAVASHWPEDMMLSFNVTPSQFSDPHLVTRILRVLEQHNRPCNMFEVELTEDSLLADEPRARRLMNELIEAGVHIALDDFGTGTSSLSLLTAYPFRRLKIDRSFVKDLHENPVNAAITKGVADLAHALNMNVTAEGIEKPQEMDYLQAFQPILAQGYLLGRPLTADGIAAHIATHQATMPDYLRTA